jgi:peptidoglycan/LPS O-acetylase OafA/YrhL
MRRMPCFLTGYFVLNTPNPPNVTGQDHLYALDGFRGLLALWVYLGHLAYAVGFQNYVLGMPALAVDLFMVLSGFLMVRTWAKSSLSKQVFLARVLQFYKARFFRIAPLYYLLLIICYLFLPSITTMHDFVQRTMPPPWAQGLENYSPSAGWNFNTLRWFYLHATFTFGLVPGMEASTPLPDWSLSLEMQFYFIFPILFWLLLHAPHLLLALLLASAAIVTPLMFGNYLTPGWIAHFGQPSFLPYRLNAFWAGMLIANYSTLRDAGTLTRNKSVVIFMASALCVAPLSKPVILAYALFALLSLRRVPIITDILSTKPLRFLGATSYSIYLVHMLIITPCVYWLVSGTLFLGLTPITRFVVALSISAPIVLTVAYGLYRYIEIPGIALGKINGSDSHKQIAP